MPLLSLDELYEMGDTHVGYVLTALFAAAKALEKTYAHPLSPLGFDGHGGAC
jgi:hypothetical protein